MNIKLEGVGKRYKAEWILKRLDFTFEEGQQYAVTGPNGSGKSTLLKMLSGHLTPSRGSIQFSYQQQPIEAGQVFKKLAYAAPYIELIEEFTLLEALRFHQQFKPFLATLQSDDLIELLGFKKARNKEIRNFSSGMKQRLKLALAICSDAPLLLLDEPTTNLDLQGMQWYLHLLDTYAQNKTLIIASNIEADFGFCQHQINILDYK